MSSSSTLFGMTASPSTGAAVDGLTIGQVARAAGVHVETLRYYERRGLLAQPPRRRSGYRAYPVATVRRIRFVKRAQDLGFSLEEIAELLDLRVTAGTGCAEVRSLAQDKLGDVRQRIDSLRKLERTLKELIAACDDERPLSECPILDALDEGAPA